MKIKRFRRFNSTNSIANAFRIENAKMRKNPRFKKDKGWKAQEAKFYDARNHNRDIDVNFY